MRRIELGSLIALATLPAAAMAQDTRDVELAAADQQLNTTYHTLVRQLSLPDQAALRAAQQAWIVFRDADCAIGFADRRDCLMQRTDEREKQLRASVYFDKRGELIRWPHTRGR